MWHVSGKRTANLPVMAAGYLPKSGRFEATQARPGKVEPVFRPGARQK
jgi:hypothetical protein